MPGFDNTAIAKRPNIPGTRPDSGAALVELSITCLLLVLVVTPVIVNVLLPRVSALDVTERIRAGFDAYSSAQFTLQNLSAEGFFENKGNCEPRDDILRPLSTSLATLTGVPGYCSVVLQNQVVGGMPGATEIFYSHDDLGSNCISDLASIPAETLAAFERGLDLSQSGIQFGLVVVNQGLAANLNSGLGTQNGDGGSGAHDNTC